MGNLQSSPSSSTQIMGNLQSNPSSSTQTFEKNYKVFLNFRGEDTRDGFTNYLYEALLRKSVETFIDEEGIEKGEEIWPKLSKTIRDSMISVLIFSKDYASSKWCLHELVEIMDCKEKNGQIVIPVFYKVTVRDVRHQKRSFKDGFDQLKKEFEENLEKEQVDSVNVKKRKFYEEMRKWRQALKATCNLKGWRVEGPESKVINEIVKDISEKLMRPYKLSLCNFKGLFGIEEQLKEVESLLCLDKTDIRIIGIWGMGGIGKTTIADAIFHQVSEDKYGKCFINVRQRLEQCGGSVSMLQLEVLKKVLNDPPHIELNGVTLPQCIKKRLCGKKVFIVLDDVDNVFKLQQLAGGLDRLHLGSRIVITTRNRDILHNCRVNDGYTYIYEVKKLSHPKAFQLFSAYAQPTEDCQNISHEIVWSINGNPLGLIVFGMSLSRSNNKEYWQSALSRLKKSSDILEKLQISYDGLGREDRHAFVDIAFFFVGEHEDYVAAILDNGVCSLTALCDRSLITISNDKTIQMHDLLLEMGREIVFNESPNNPGKRSRLWKQEDVLDTLKNCDGTREIRGISLNMSGMNEEKLSSQAFEEMKNLRYIKFYDSTFCEYWYYTTFDGSQLYSSKLFFPVDISYLSNKLRSLNWLGYPLKAPPSNSITKLVELNLRHSNIEELWEGYTCAPKLKWIVLRGCPHLIKISDLLNAPLLEKIDIQYCESLLGLPPRNCFPVLKYLHLLSCNKLTRISNLLDAPLLEKVEIQECKNLLSFPSPVQDFNNLRELTLCGCDNLQSFPNNIPFLSLVSLNLSWCINLARISDRLHAPLLQKIDLHHCESLLDFPPPADQYKNLRQLHLGGCGNLQNFPNDIPFPSLVSIDLSGCINLARICNFLNAPLLEKIDLEDCKSLLGFPPPAQHFNRLRELILKSCQRLRSFPSNIQFPLLIFLDLQNCSTLLEFSSSVDQPFNNLRELNVSDCKKLQSFGKNIHFPSLISLDLARCHSLAEFSDLLDAPLLETINLEHCSSLLYFPAPFQHFNNLCNLNLKDCKNLRRFPSNNIHFPSLISLGFDGCVNLTKFPHISGNIKTLYVRGTAIDEVPSSIENLPELVRLDLEGCTMLKHISISICKLKALTDLNLRNCSALECFPEILELMRGLEILDLSGTTIKKLHHSIQNLSGLGILCLRECENLNEVPSSIENLTKLVKLDLAKCTSLKNISFSICKLRALRELNLSNCSSFECFPEILDTMENLKILDLSGTAIKGLHDSIKNLSGLNKLSLRECKNLEMLPISIYNLTSPSILDLSGCSKLENLLGNSVTDLSNCCGVCPIYEKHNIPLPSSANETWGADHQDFGETLVKEQGKIRKFSDEAETSGRSNEDVIEIQTASQENLQPTPYKQVADLLLNTLNSVVCSCSWSCLE